MARRRLPTVRAVGRLKVVECPLFPPPAAMLRLPLLAVPGLLAASRVVAIAATQASLSRTPVVAREVPR